MNDYMHYLFSNRISECEERLWQLVKSLLGREKTEETSERFSDILNKLVRPDHEALKNGLPLPPYKEPDSLENVELISTTELTLVMALMTIQSAERSLNNDKAELCIKQITLAHELLGMATSSAESDSAVKDFLSSIAKRAAGARHVENRQLKADGLAWYAANKHNYSSKDDAAFAMTKVVPVKFRTARDWLTNQ